MTNNMKNTGNPYIHYGYTQIYAFYSKFISF